MIKDTQLQKGGHTLEDYRQKYQEIEIKGKGTSGCATLVKSRVDGLEYISKKVVLNGLSPREQDQAVQEVRILQNMHHPNVVKYYDHFFERDHQLVTIMEYCRRGDLAQHLGSLRHRDTPLSQEEILNFMLQLTLALEYIHNRHIVHRDVKTSNLLLTEQGYLKLSDFGVSKVLSHTQEHCKTFVGTPYYLCPEVCQGDPYSAKADVWALGVVLYELCTLGRHPWPEQNGLMSLLNAIIHQPVPSLPSSYSSSLQQLSTYLLNKDPLRRPASRDILLNPLIIVQLRQFMLKNAQPKGHAPASANTKQKLSTKEQQKLIYEQKLHLKKAGRDHLDQNINSRISHLKEKAKEDFRRFKEAKEKQSVSKPLHQQNACKQDHNEEQRQRDLEEQYMGNTIQSLDYTAAHQKLSSIKRQISKDSDATEHIDLFYTKEPNDNSPHKIQGYQQEDKENQGYQQEDKENHQVEKRILKEGTLEKEPQEIIHNDQTLDQQYQERIDKEECKQEKGDDNGVTVRIGEEGDNRVEESRVTENEVTMHLQRSAEKSIKSRKIESLSSTIRKSINLGNTQRSGVSFNLSLTQDSVFCIQRLAQDTGKWSGGSSSEDGLNSRAPQDLNAIYGQQLMASLTGESTLKGIQLNQTLSAIKEDSLEMSATPNKHLSSTTNVYPFTQSEKVRHFIP